MSDSKVNFNLVAPVYDLLGQLMFGQNLKQAQETHLDILERDDVNEVLILGGGTGWILESIKKIKKPLSVTYIEASQQMMKLSQQRDHSDLNVEFVLSASHLNLSQGRQYDLVITNFYLDVFPQPQLSEVLAHVSEHIRQGGYWIMTDFAQPERKSQKILLKMMFCFFRVFSGLRNRRLDDYARLILSKRDTLLRHKSFLDGFVRSHLFQLKDN